MDATTSQRRESPAFNATMLVIAQALVALIAVIFLYFAQVSGDCPDDQCSIAWAVNTGARWGLILLFAATLMVTVATIALRRPSTRIPAVGLGGSVLVAVVSIALVLLLPVVDFTP